MEEGRQRAEEQSTPSHVRVAVSFIKLQPLVFIPGGRHLAAAAGVDPINRPIFGRRFVQNGKCAETPCTFQPRYLSYQNMDSLQW